MIALWLSLALAAEDGSAVSQQVKQRVEGLESLLGRFTTMTYRFTMSERMGSHMTTPAQLAVKFRKPFDLYLHYDGDVHNGRMVLYKRGWNDDNIRVRPSSWLPVMNLAPRGRMAMQGQRHSIFEGGPLFVSRQIISDAKKVQAHPSLTAEFVASGFETLEGSKAFCWTSIQPKDQIPDLYAAKANICIDEATGFPARVVVWDLVDGEHVLIEDYRYANIRVDPPLTDLDFDPENPDYNF